MTIEKRIGIDSKGRSYVDLRDMEVGVRSESYINQRKYFKNHEEALKFYESEPVYTETQVRAQVKQYRNLK